jgi:hypothetical protein
VADLGSIADNSLRTLGSPLTDAWEIPSGADNSLRTLGMVLDGIHGPFWQNNAANRSLQTYGMQLDGIHGPPWDNNGSDRSLQTYGSTGTTEVFFEQVQIDDTSDVQTELTTVFPPTSPPVPVLPPFPDFSSIIQCFKRINQCLPCNDDPILNISAEEPDHDRFISNISYFGPYGPGATGPRIGQTFLNAGCKALCFSTESQEAADLCALMQAQQCAWDTWKNSDGTPVTIFGNNAGQCTTLCPDGSTFTWFQAAGTILGFSQQEANLLAASQACRMARRSQICISTTELNFCKDIAATNKRLRASGGTPFFVNALNFGFLAANCPGEISVGQTIPYLWTSTDLPAGLTLHACSGIIDGTPTAAGTFSIIIRATDGIHSFQEKTITLNIVEITNSNPLPDGTPETNYLENLSTNIGDQELQTWTVVDGTLPTGLELTSAGVLHGTPEDAVSTGYIFTIRMTSSEFNLMCEREFMLTIVADTFLEYQSSGYKYMQIAFEGTPPAGWDEIAFDDSLWSTGTAGFGGGGMTCPLMGTVATSWAPDSDLLLRRTVVIPGGTTGVQVKMAIDNDIVELYWNGTLIASNQVHDFCPVLDEFSFNVPDGILLPGANKLAVWVRDRGGPSFVDCRVIA